MTTALSRPTRRYAEAQAVLRAARRYQIDAGLIAAVLADEAARLDMADHAQHLLARLLCALPPRPAQRLERFLAWLLRRPLATHSLGRAQMKLVTLRELGSRALLDVPSSTQEQVRLLLDPLAAPYLVAARLRQTTDHWQAGGVDLTRRPEILGTLYSLGLTGKAGVHPFPRASARGEQIAASAQHAPKAAAPFTLPWAQP